MCDRELELEQARDQVLAPCGHILLEDSCNDLAVGDELELDASKVVSADGGCPDHCGKSQLPNVPFGLVGQQLP